MSNMFDSKFFDSPRWDMYKSWVFPELHPNQPKPRLENWHPEDLVSYCGGEFVK